MLGLAKSKNVNEKELRLCLAYLAFYDWKNKSIRVKQDTVAQVLSVSRRSIVTWTKKLVEKGFFKIERTSYTTILYPQFDVLGLDGSEDVLYADQCRPTGNSMDLDTTHSTREEEVDKSGMAKKK